MQKVKTITLKIIKRPSRFHVIYDGTITTPFTSFMEAITQIIDDRKSGIIEQDAQVKLRD